jgi:hypothetical protein
MSDSAKINLPVDTIEEDPIVASASDMYTIPKGAQSEAKKALDWHAEHHRGGTPVGLNTARILAKGGQIGIAKVRHIAKYFPRHEVDKKGEGYTQGEKGFPSNGRIAWALWGGDVARTWSQSIVDRENKKVVTASGDSYEDYYIGMSYQDFQDAIMDQDLAAPEFLARVCMDGSGIDRLYKIDQDGQVYVWDNGTWDNLGNIENDVWTYDRALDDPYDDVQKTHVSIDPESAITVAARLDGDPFTKVTIGDIDAAEAALAARSIKDINWEDIDSFTSTNSVFATSAEGYTAPERSINADRQARGGHGKFAPEGKNGKKGTAKEDAVGPASEPTLAPLDTSGILGHNRTPINVTTGRIPGTLPALTTHDLHSVLYNWSGWVQGERNIAQSSTFATEGNAPKTIDAYNHPLLVDWRANKDKHDDSDPNMEWASPVLADGAPAKQLTPDTSDVQPLYLAIVADDDLTQVISVVALVPESNVSPAPMVYTRNPGTWTRDEATLNDLKSATPPTTVPLTSAVMTSLVANIDQPAIAASAVNSVDHVLMVLWGPKEELLQAYREESALVAAGGIDRNKGNAEKLRRYWVHGEGAAKIRWGQGGDWARCVRHLSKYLGERAKGYCELRHQEATGETTSQHAEHDRSAHSTQEFIMEEVLTKNYGKKTVITDKDMLMPIDEILKKQDPIYAEKWCPAAEMEELMQDESCREEMCNFAATSEHLDADPCWDGYKQIGFKDKSGRHVPNCVKANSAISAAGGLDQNAGDAEKLRHYWTHGAGGLKIRWNTNGDWTRCVRHLAKYLGPRAKGYCALRHREMTSMWPGDRANRSHFGITSEGKTVFSTEVLRSSEEILAIASKKARTQEIKDRFGLTASAPISEGSSFIIPLVIPESMESGDGRQFEDGAITMRELPLPLMWQIKTADGHNGSVVVGRIDKMERIDGGIGNATGVFDTGAYGSEAERLVRSGFLKGVSADMDQFEATEMPAIENSESDDTVGNGKLIINKARIMGVTIVAKPAFQECKIFLSGENNNQEETVIPNGVQSEESAVEAAALVACGIVAGVIPVTPPTEWFENPKLSGPTPLTVDDQGRVFGHIAAWHVDHIGMAYGTKPPRSKSNYSYFHTGVVRTDSGSDVPVGQLTLAGGHASLEASAYEAVKHYDDTASAIADVHAGEDRFGIWVAGSLRPDATPSNIRALRASAPSGDWRPIKGNLELVAVCQVNVPGFPIARARVASGAVMALVAAGASELAKMKLDPATTLNTASDIESRLMFAKSRLEKALVASAPQDLSTQVTDLYIRVYEAELAYIPQAERQKLAKTGEAMPDGSFPIKTKDDVKAAIHAYGRAKKSHKAAVRKHIQKRARALGVAKLIPENWKSAASDSITASVETMRNKIAEFSTVSAEATESVVELSLETVESTELTSTNAYEFSIDLSAAKAAVDSVLGAKTPGSNVEDVVAEDPTTTPPLLETEQTHYADLSPIAQDLIKNTVDLVEKNLSKGEAPKVLNNLKDFIMGAKSFNEREISDQMSKLINIIA